jgi:type I restriction enzyme S subunit
MVEWPIYTVHQLVELGVMERPMDGNHGSIHPKTNDYVESGIPFIMASDLKGGRVDLINCAFISEGQAGRLAKGFSKPGDVLLSHKATLGRTAIVQDNDFPFIMLTPQVTYYRIKDRSRLNNRFLKYYFNSRLFLDIFEAWAGGGSTRAYLGITAQRDLPIPMPPIKVQVSIAELIGPLDDKIELNRRMNETLEAMARTIFKDWFVDFGPTRAKMEGRAPYLAPDIWSLFPDRLDADGKPEGWIGKPLDQVADFLNGLALQKYPPNGGLSLPVIKIAQLRAGNVGSADLASSEISPNYIVEDGDVLFSWSGSLLHRVWTAGRGALNQHLFKVTSTQFPKWFYFYWIAKHMPSFQATAASKATTMGHIQRHHLTRAATVVGSPSIMEAADGLIAPLFNRQIANDLESRTLAITRDLLLPKLMSGEIRLRDAEKAVEAAQ